MAPHRSPVWRCIVVAAICVGAYWSASGLLQFHEVFFSPTAHASMSPPLLTPPPASASPPRRQYDRLVVVLVDALRADMVLGADAMYGRAHDEDIDAEQDLSQHMQFTRSLLTSGVAAGYVAHASVPTVTMPRLKALLSGKPPAFIDILKNFNSVALADENVVQLMRENGFRIVFYGDDTWLKLFPDAFQRAEGTSGFYTRDTVEVDDNVTRHLRDELDPLMGHPKSQDWDVLVLHYLGLDHVGHLRGPRSSMMKDKLHEMDAVVELVYESVRRQDAVRRDAADAHGGAGNVKPTLIALCSDHGMSEIGNHGGATVEESSALMAFMRGDGKPLGTQDHASTPIRRLQVDLVPTIAALFGIRIPIYNTGLLLQDVVAKSISNKSPSARTSLIQALHANAVQLHHLASVKFPEQLVDSIFADLDRRVHQLSSSAPLDDKELDGLLSELVVVCQQLQEKVGRSNGSEYDLPLVAAGITVLLISAIVATLFAAQLVRHQRNSLSSSAARVAMGAFVMSIVSLSSTSSIENEHATVFFIISSFLVGMLIDAARRREPPGQLKVVALLCASLVCIRLLRERSQVINFARLNEIAVDSSLPGNEFAADDSLSVWFTGPLLASLKLPQPVFHAVIWCTTAIGAAMQWDLHRSSGLWLVGLLTIFTVGMGASVRCSQLSGNSSERDQVDFAPRSVYGAVFLLVALGTWCGKSAVWTSIDMALWLLTSLVQKASNLPSLAVLCVLLRLLSASFRAQAVSRPDPFGGLVAVWVASAAFFALGNSHLVTTIDISQSYHGLEGYSQELVGALTFINVFSGPLLVFSSCADWQRRLAGQSNDKNGGLTSVVPWIVLSYQAFRLAFYTIIVFLMRFHLFIWSVFAPKMLYEVVFTVVIALFALTI